MATHITNKSYAKSTYRELSRQAEVTLCGVTMRDLDAAGEACIWYPTQKLIHIRQEYNRAYEPATCTACVLLLFQEGAE